MRLVTVGVGAANSPRYAPAGLLVARRGVRVLLDGGPGAEPSGRLEAWLVTDEQAELMPQLRRLAGRRGLRPHVGDVERGDLRITARPVVHTNHPTFGYLIEAPEGTVVWAPEFFEFPQWAGGAALMFADAAGWERPIWFAGGVGGHLNVPAVAEAARRHGVGRLVFAHIGRPTIRAIDRGERPGFGELARDGQVFQVINR
jgi:GNAT superfamily N-acetyltransferase